MVLIFCAIHLFTVLNVYANIWIRDVASDFCDLDPSSTLQGDCNDADRSVKGLARKHLLEIKGEEIGGIHHRLERRVRHFMNKGR